MKNQLGNIHPLLAAAAVAVIVASLTGVAALTGLIHPHGAAPTAVVAAVQPVLQAPSQAPAPVKHHVTDHRVIHDRAPVDRAPVDRAPVQEYRAQACGNCGYVDSIVAVQEPQPTSGVGVGLGAVVGGLLGNQVGGGRGRTLATVAGAVGGGFAGNEIERRNYGVTRYQIHVRMDDGSMRTFTHGTASFGVGERVHVVNGDVVN